MTSKELKEKYPKYRDRILHMSNKQILARTLFLFVIMCTITVALYIVLNGVPFFGLPSAKNIVKVEISSPRLTEETVVVENPDYVEYARNLVEFANTKFMAEPVENPGEPIVTIKYITEKGEVCELAANDNVVFFNGEALPVHKPETFVTAVEAVFFSEFVDLSELTN